MSQLEHSQSNDSSVHFPNMIKGNHIDNLEHLSIRNENQSNPLTENDNNQNHEVQNLVKVNSYINPTTTQAQTQTVNSPSYRFITYAISNKKYQINQHAIPDQPSEIQQEIPQIPWENNFRQPINNNNFFFRNILNRRPINNQPRNWFNKTKYLSKNRSSYSNSILSYAKKLYQYVKSVQISYYLEYLPFVRQNLTLQSKYKHVSTAILNNSINLDVSVIKALQYNIPLMQIIINPANQKQQKIVLQKILKQFNISHFINQNFVLYGDWNYLLYRDVFRQNYQKENYRQTEVQSRIVQQGQSQIYQKINQSQQINQNFKQTGKIVFRKGQLVFAEIDLNYVDKIDNNQFQTKLEEIRDHYYRHKLNEVPEDKVHSDLSKSNSKVESEEESHSERDKRQPKKTVKQIEDQILNEYLQKKRIEEIVKKDNQEIYSESDYDSSQYSERSPFSTPQKVSKIQKKRQSPTIEYQMTQQQKQENQQIDEEKPQR